MKLFVAVLTSKPELIDEVELRLSQICGAVDLRSDFSPFDGTHYYDEEMGTPIQRIFLSFAELILPWNIASLKIRTNELETEFAGKRMGPARPVNLDPGYLDQAKVVLASTKDFSHRIIISDGIYAEVTLHYQGGDWRSWPWTFPDFRTGRYNAFFSAMREKYRNQLKALPASD